MSMDNSREIMLTQSLQLTGMVPSNNKKLSEVVLLIILTFNATTFRRNALIVVIVVLNETGWYAASLMKNYCVILVN